MANYIDDGWREIQERDGHSTPVVRHTLGIAATGTLEGAGMPRQSGATVRASRNISPAQGARTADP